MANTLSILPEFVPSDTASHGPGKGPLYRPIGVIVAESLEGLGTPVKPTLRGIQHELALPDGRRLCFCTRYSDSPAGFRLKSMARRHEYSDWWWSRWATASLIAAGEAGAVSGVVVRAWSSCVSMWVWIPWGVLREPGGGIVEWADTRLEALGSLDGPIEFARLL